MARKSKPISFISWNTVEFLKNKLDELVTKNIIIFYMFIKHFREDDETKDHIHLFVIPNGTIDTDAFRELFTEYDPQNPNKPIRLSPYKPSKFLDAYLYFLHDKKYLASIGQSRKYHYEPEQFVTSSFDYMHDLYLTADKSKLNGSKISFLMECIERGMSFTDALETGNIPIQQISQNYQAWQLLSKKITDRNGREGHD